MLERIARWCFHRRRLVLVLWIVGFIAFGAFGSAMNGGYTQSTDLPGSDAVAGFNLQRAEGKAMSDAAKKASGNGVTFALSGGLIQNAEFSNGGGSEGAGILVAALILLVAFGSIIAMGLPILMAVVGIGIGFAI